MKVSINASGSANVNVLPKMKGKAEFSLIQPLPVTIIQTLMCFRQLQVKKGEEKHLQTTYHYLYKPNVGFNLLVGCSDNRKNIE